MFFGKENWYYHSSIRRYTVLFGSIFTDMWIKRVSEESNREDFIKIPLRFGRGDLYEKLDQTSEARENQRIKQILPAMAFDLTDIAYDNSRKINEMQKTKSSIINEDMSRNWTYAPMPYTLEFTLYIKTKNFDDALQIYEQIVPVFNSDLTIKVEDLDANQVKVSRDITISMSGYKMSDNNYEINKEQREIEIEITFDLYGYIYGRTMNTPVILETQVLGLMTSDFTLTPIEVMFDYNVTNSQTTIDEMQSNINVGNQFKQVETELFEGMGVGKVKSATKTRTRSKRESK
jgi:hypothetical protein